MAVNFPIKPLSEVGLSERELKHLTAAWLSCKNGDDIDYDKFAALAGYPSVANARKRLGEIKKKVRTQVFGDSAAGRTETAVTTKKATTPKRKGGLAREDGPPQKKAKAAVPKAKLDVVAEDYTQDT